jgi:[protein-PII] uridylyltransferase
MATPAIAGTSLRAALDHTFTALPQVLRVPGAGGAVCLQIADVYDHALAARFAQACAGVSAPLALVATGGWARRELAPYSDIDFIVLHDRDEATAKQVSDRLLYPLWDEKLAIGHQIREARAAARLARDDLATATALLDARHIAGEQRLTTELVRATLSVLAPGGNPNDLITALATEKKARHDRFGASLYLLEPNLKQGIGALRDLSTALWAAQVRWHPPRPGHDPESAEALIGNLVAMGHLTRRQGDVLGSARDFMLRIRALVQVTTKRRFDQLTFEIQEAIAPSLYPDARPHEGEVRSAVAPAVEALMSDYYLHARGVVQVADRLLESARVPKRRKPRIAQIDQSFITFNGELAIKDPRLFSERPSEMVRLFRVAVAEQLPVYGHTSELIAETIARDPAPLANDPLASKLLLDALVDIRDAAQPSAFELMNQLGILSVLMPEWAPCVGRVQHDLYHVYTVDQHQLYALAMQKRLARGELAEEHGYAVELWKQVKRPAALFLGTLLHDVGKPLGKGHAEKGAVVAQTIARRLGMSEDDADVTEFLVRQHLTMAHVSQRRDLTDPEVIARFAERIGSEDRLTKLYLLTLCDTAMTAPDNLNAWKAGLMRELTIRAGRFFRGESLRGESTESDTDTREVEMRDKIVSVASGDGALDAKVARELADGIDPRVVMQLTARQAARHIKLVAGARHKHPPVALEVHCFPMRGHSELSIVAPDAPGVLAAIAGALTANRIDVLGAFLGHVDLPKMEAAGFSPAAGIDRRRLVIDTFYVRDLKGEAIPDDDPRWNRLTNDLRELLASAPDPGQVATLIAKRRPKSGMPKRVTPGVITEIRLHDDSTQATIVEVFTQDRVGVLYAITQTLADLGLDISLAKVSTEGEKVADVFYVHRAGERITDANEREVLTSRLRLAVEASGLTGS